MSLFEKLNSFRSKMLRRLTSSLLPTSMWMVILIAHTLNSSPCLALDDDDAVQVMDVLCSITGMSMKIEVKGGFDGVVFSQKHFKDPDCRYRLPEFRRFVRFSFPTDKCGTEVEPRDEGIHFSNFIVVQRNPFVETNADAVLTVSCKVDLNFTMLPQPHKPLNYDLRYETEFINARMDFKVGVSVSRSQSVQTVSVGERFYLVVHHENGRGHDARIKKCWAHSGPVVENSSAALPIFDVTLCTPTEYTRELTFDREFVNVTKALTYIELKAFRFPDSFIMYFSCTVEVCEPRCVDYCRAIEASTQGVKQRVKRFKRDVVEPETRGFGERFKLMKATINALKKTIIKQQSQTSTDAPDLVKRISRDDNDPAFVDREQTFEHNDGDQTFEHDDGEQTFEHDDGEQTFEHNDGEQTFEHNNGEQVFEHNEGEQTIVDDGYTMTMIYDHGDIEKTLMHTPITTEPSNDFEFNLTRNLVVLPLLRVSKANEGWFEALTKTVPDGAFLFLCGLIGVVVFLLFFICIISITTMVSHLKANKINDFDKLLSKHSPNY